ncbi:MAG: YdeI/OmpD-associated family protein [Steroidobacteraceae bacterium]
MKNSDVDAYIAKSPEFARPILAHLRSLMHKATPDIEETMKWSVPHFEHKSIVASMGGRKVKALADLPSDALLIRTIRAAVALNEEDIRPNRELTKKPQVKAPPYLVAALEKNAKAKKTFQGFTPSQQREYVNWLTEAKQETTREKRLATTLEWLAKGKQRYWKYQNC